MEGEGKQFESKEASGKRIVRVSADTYGVSEFLEIPAGLDLKKEKEAFDSELSDDEKDEGPHDLGVSFIERLIKKGANKIVVDEFDID